MCLEAYCLKQYRNIKVITLWEDIIVQYERVLRFRKRYLKPGEGREIRESRGCYTSVSRPSNLTRAVGELALLCFRCVARMPVSGFDF